MLFLGVFVVGMFLSPRIGPAWDEPDNIYAGGQILAPSLVEGRIYTQEPSFSHYPPVPNYVGMMIALAGERLGWVKTPHDIIVAFHFAAALFFALLVATMYRFGRLLGLSVWSSVFAAIATFLYPTLFGHGYSNIKDIAQASLFTVSLYYLVRGGKGVIIGGVVWGLGLAAKFNAIYVPIIWGIWMLFSRKKLLFIAYSLFLIASIGAIAAVAVWPYLWGDPIGRASEVVRYFTTVGQGYRAFWDGTLYQVGVGNVLWWYPWANLLLVTPVPLLILGALGGLREIRERRGLLLLWLVVPMVRAFLPNAAFYDGLRHFLEVLPAWVLLAAIGMEQLGRLGRWGVGALVVGQLLFINVTYFPYSTGYYNVLAKNPNVRFDRDIEALSVKEGIEYLHTKYGAIRLWSPIGGHLSWYYLMPEDRYVYSGSEADSIILVNKSSHIRQTEFDKDSTKSFVLDHVIRRGDAIFAWVYRKHN